MDPLISTARLKLTLIATSDINSKDLEYFHRIWSDDGATIWSHNGRRKTLEESQERLQALLRADGPNHRYAVHRRAPSASKNVTGTDNDCGSAGHETDGCEVIGMVALRSATPTLPIPPPSEPSVVTDTFPQVTTPTSTSRSV